MPDTPLVLPELREPTVLAPHESRGVTRTYQHWLHDHVRQAGGAELEREFFEVMDTIGQLHALPFPRRCLIMASPNSPRSALLEAIEKFLSVLGDSFVPAREFKADLACIIAETADFFIRSTAQTTGSTPEGAAKFVQSLVGISSLQKVADYYDIAARLYESGVMQIVVMLQRTQSDDPVRAQFAQMDQLVVKHLGAKTRTLLMQMAMRIETHNPTVRFTIASGFEVLPQLGAYPEARAGLVSMKQLQGTLGMLDYFMAQPFNDPSIAVGLFNNIITLALILGDYSYARHACQIARKYAGLDTPPQLVQQEGLIETLDPTRKA